MDGGVNPGRFSTLNVLWRSRFAQISRMDVNEPLL